MLASRFLKKERQINIFHTSRLNRIDFTLGRRRRSGLIFFPAIVAAVAIVAAAGFARADLPAGWSDADIGGAAGGSGTFSGGVFTVTGSGTGMGSASDQIHFTSATLDKGGDFRLTARLVSLTGVVGSEVGLAVRQGNPAGGGSMAAVTYEPLKGNGPNPNFVDIFARDAEPGANYPWKQMGMPSFIQVPCWLQLVRHGNNFAVYKSSNGKDWAQIEQSSGGAFAASGAIQVGLFVASGGTGTATATFDNVGVEPNAVLPYESSWIGDTYSSDGDGYVSGGTTAMYVAPDGTCYTTSFWDEGGELSKRYKDGKVLGPFGVAPNHGAEGSITGDGKHLYYPGYLGGRSQELVETGMSTQGSEGFKSLFFQTPLINPKTGGFSVSGLACGNGELYVSDAFTGQVLVAKSAQSSYGFPYYGASEVVTHAIDTSGVTNPAPQAVYQSAFRGDAFSLSIPGLSSNNLYNVRLHFAETNPDDGAIGKRIMDLHAGSHTIPNYDIFKTAGALYKATVVSISEARPDGNGNLIVGVSKSAGTVDGWATISGIEIDNMDGTPALRLNCGGGDAGDWKTTIQELPDRAFPFTRPGPIAVDKSGNLWIVQEGAKFPLCGNFTPVPGWAAIKCYDKNGHYLNKQITDVVNPGAVSYDGVNDRLLVAENGPAQNIRIYNLSSGTSTAPVLAGSFGVNGGVFAGKTPGLLHDPEAGGDARFFGPVGVGMDAKGNIYVACDPGSTQTDIRAFSPNGNMLWKLQGLEMCTTGDFDPTVSAPDVWTTTHHYAMDYSGAKAGGEWSLKSYTTDPFAPYPFPDNLGGANAVYRKVGKTPLLFTGGQGGLGTPHIFRFVGEQLVPCGSIASQIVNNDWVLEVWSDANGDGIQQPNEVANIPAVGGGARCMDVDNDGNIYLAMEAGGTNPKIQELLIQGFNSHGVPIYSAVHKSLYPSPAPFDQMGVQRLRYMGGPLDTMYLLGRNEGDTVKDGNYGGTLGCYDHWSTTPTKRFVTVLPTPVTDPNFVQGKPYSPDGFFYMGFDAVNGYAFVSELWGKIHVVDPQGNLLPGIIPGPEISGLCAWEDEAMGVRAHFNPDTGEYYILQENSGFRARQNFYRWKPSGEPLR